jgi:hypothetical protein
VLKELGALPIHRRSFARVRQALGLDPIQPDLFAPEEEQIAREIAAGSSSMSVVGQDFEMLQD